MSKTCILAALCLMVPSVQIPDFVPELISGLLYSEHIACMLSMEQKLIVLDSPLCDNYVAKRLYVDWI